MNKSEIICIINKYQGQLDSISFKVISKGKSLLDKVDDEEKVNVEEIINKVKSTEAGLIKLLNQYVTELENN